MKLKFFALTLISVLVVGCYTSKEDVFVSDLDLVLVDFDEDYDFTAPRTFYMPDSVQKLGRPEDGDEDEGLYDDDILSAIRTNMLDAGFREITDVENVEPDVVILPQTVVSRTYLISDPCFWGCWGWNPWYPGWGWGPGWGWPYPPIIVGSFTKGTVFVNMINPKAPREEQVIDLVWLGLINGLVEGSEGNVRSRITSGIDRTFELSPYLNR